MCISVDAANVAPDILVPPVTVGSLLAFILTTAKPPKVLPVVVYVVAVFALDIL